MTNEEKIEAQSKEIKELKELLIKNNIIKKDKSKAFSSITIDDLRELDIIDRNMSDDIFNSWFDNDIEIDSDIDIFLEKLLDKYGKILKSYNEYTLIVKFIGLILEKVDFMNKELKISDFYHSPLSFKNDKINFNGYCDFYVAKGLQYPEKPYFFIQEYKPSQGGGDPEPQIVAELISAIELNNWKIIKGAYVIGAIWNFVILEKLEKDKYQYFVSKDFLSTNIEDLKSIFRNLLFVKNEIIEMVQKDI